MLTTFEILLTIVTPLLALYLRGGWPSRTVAGCMVCIAVVWYLTYAPIHELSHAAATLLAGGRVLEVKLIPSFWEGTLAVAWVTTAGLDQPWQQLAMGGAFYAVDVACVAVSLAVIRPRQTGNALAVGLLVMLLCLRPAFDLVCETVGFVSGFRGDLWHAEAIIGSAALWSFLVVALALCLLSVVVILRRYGRLAEPLQPIRLQSSTAAARRPSTTGV